jgi:mono/diheme cytochrome c family protein
VRRALTLIRIRHAEPDHPRPFSGAPGGPRPRAGERAARGHLPAGELRALPRRRARRAPPFRELHRRYPVDDLAEAFAEGITTGHPSMPEYRLAPDQIEDVLAYLRSLAPARP